MLLRKLVVVGLAGLLSLATSIATAEDAVGPGAALVGIDGISLADPADAFSDRFQVNFNEAAEARFASLAPATERRRSDDYRRYELELVTGAGGFDVSFAQRAGIGFNNRGDVDRESRSSELRLGRGLRDMPRQAPSPQPRWYIFAASEDEALTWQPGGRSEFGLSSPSFALQDRVEIGDIQAGITYEQNGWQASLAYVEREISVRSGSRTFSQDQDFTGITLTMRH